MPDNNTSPNQGWPESGSAGVSFIDVFGATAQLVGALAFPAALDYLVPKLPTRPQTAGDRASWYVQSGQWRADARTVVGFVQFPLDVDPDTQRGSGRSGTAVSLTQA